MPRSRKDLAKTQVDAIRGYDTLFADIAGVIEDARRASARAVNALMTATYWLIGRRIVEVEQRGRARAGYGEALLVRLSADLTARFGRGFSADNLETMRMFYETYPPTRISETASRKSPRRTRSETLSRDSEFGSLALRFRLSWSHYAMLVRARSESARDFYEKEALRSGWTVRQLRRQIESQFYERTALSRNKATLMRKGETPKPGDELTPDDEIRDPYVLEFLGLRDEYSEARLEEALVQHLETFLLELGGDFAFVGRQRRLRIGDAWFRVDLVFFHRRLRCLVVIDLKLGALTHADAGQMHLYLNYAREHWTRPGENPPVGLILCAKKDRAVAKYALEGLPNKVLAAEYQTALPRERLLVEEIEKTRHALERRPVRPPRTRRRPPRAR